MAAQRVLATLRFQSQPVPAALVDVLVGEGLTCLEISLITPRALATLREIRERFGDEVVLGGGGAVNADMARLALRMGADFVACHGFSGDMVDVCLQHQVLPLPGVMTATEAIQAWHAGARLAKVFPAHLLGPDYLRELQRPLPWLGFVPTGGITAGNAAAFIEAGAVAVGVGRWLASDDDLAAQDWQAVAARARELKAAVESASEHN